MQRPTSWAISAAFLGAISGSTEAEQPLRPVLGRRMLATQEAVLAPALAELPMVMFLSFRTDCLLQLGLLWTLRHSRRVASQGPCRQAWSEHPSHQCRTRWLSVLPWMFCTPPGWPVQDIPNVIRPSNVADDLPSPITAFPMFGFSQGNHT